MKKVLFVLIVLSIFFSGCDLFMKKQLEADNTVEVKELKPDSVKTTGQLIDTLLTQKVRPHIHSWLSHYKIDIDSFLLVAERRFNLDSLNHKDNPYYSDFTEEGVRYVPELRDYSPDKKRYVGLIEAMYPYLGEDGKYHFGGSDDSQPIRLVDTAEKRSVLISFRGINDFADAVFWIDDTTFALVGYSTIDEIFRYTLEIYDLEREQLARYELADENSQSFRSYILDDMLFRGIIIDN